MSTSPSGTHRLDQTLALHLRITGLNVGYTFSKVIGGAAIHGSRPAGSTTFDLDDLNKHGTTEHLALSYGESALYLSTLGHPVFGNPPTKFVEIFFREERLAWQEGWRPPHAETNLLTLPPMIFRLKEANPPEATKAEAGGLLETVVEMLFHKEHASQLPCWKGGPNC
ncbi:hypothetical protein RQP46_002752 [Phenoliferia psychrophenolica]